MEIMTVIKSRGVLPWIAPVFAISFFIVAGFVQTAIAQESENGSRYEFKVITYNVAGLPETITQGRGFPPLEKRFAYIGKRLRDYDIIGLQEMFVEERSIIEDKLGKYYVAHGTDTQSYQKTGSGVYIFSKWSITQSLFQMWRDAVEADALSHKGFVVATTKVSDELSIDVYSMHLQAGKPNVDIRNKQHEQLLEGMKMFSFGQGRPIIVMGDFNCKRDYDEFMERMKNLGFTHVMPGLEHVDHIFFHPNGSGWKISAHDTRHILGEKVGDGLRISDHQAVETVIVFEK